VAFLLANETLKHRKMKQTDNTPNISAGVVLAVLATLIWSGNFIIARGVIKDIPPITLSFFRWLSATVILVPFAWKYIVAEFRFVKERPLYFLLTAVTGVSMFNTFVYIAGHYSTAINMALLGTCSSPILSVIFARIFLKERITGWRMAGMMVCIAGVLLLLSKGSWDTLSNFRFTKGDWWVLAAAFTFAVYNTAAKKRPLGMKPANFLFTIFLVGTIILLPFYIYELNNKGGILITASNIGAILYLGLGASVICFLIWNKTISILGTGRTALFGNLIPVFSSIEAVILLNENLTAVHLISFVLVVAGLIVTNIKK
jgi:drug/metabolite transporter (DMT)-like permease